MRTLRELTFQEATFIRGRVRWVCPCIIRVSAAPVRPRSAPAHGCGKVARPDAEDAATRIHPDLAAAIGRTPLIRLRRAWEPTGSEIRGKAEFLHPRRSINDRTALGPLRRAAR